MFLRCSVRFQCYLISTLNIQKHAHLEEEEHPPSLNMNTLTFIMGFTVHKRVYQKNHKKIITWSFKLKVMVSRIYSLQREVIN